MQIRHLFICLAAFFVLAFLDSSPVNAAKKRVWTSTSSKTNAVSTSTKPSYSVKLRSDRKALTLYLYSVATAKSIEYELTYTGNGIEQGVYGSVNSGEGNSVSRLLLFGTCSHNVCTYHSNLQNMVLKITSKTNNGKTYIKRYRIKA